ncbi:unnamed protein product, partial [Ectocarpus sp. 8 AP-2014]
AQAHLRDLADLFGIDLRQADPPEYLCPIGELVPKLLHRRRVEGQQVVEVGLVEDEHLDAHRCAHLDEHLEGQAVGHQKRWVAHVLSLPISAHFWGGGCS